MKKTMHVQDFVVRNLFSLPAFLSCKLSKTWMETVEALYICMQGIQRI